MSVCCPLAECSSIIPSHPSLCKSFFYFFCTFLSFLWKMLIPSQFFELIFLLLFLSDWWVSSLMPDIWRLRWCLMCRKMTAESPLVSLPLSSYVQQAGGQGRSRQCLSRQKKRDIGWYPSGELAACYCRNRSLSSPLWCLTSVFGMGTGVSIMLSPPDLLRARTLKTEQ